MEPSFGEGKDQCLVDGYPSVDQAVQELTEILGLKMCATKSSGGPLLHKWHPVLVPLETGGLLLTLPWRPNTFSPNCPVIEVNLLFGKCVKVRWPQCPAHWDIFP